VTGGVNNTWQRTLFDQRSGTWALSDSPFGPYGNDTQSYIRLGHPLDLASKHFCWMDVWANRDFGPDAVLAVETAADTGGWVPIAGLAGSSDGYEKWQVDLSSIEGHSAGWLTFVFFSDEADQHEGIVMDDLEISCVPPVESYTGAKEDYDIWDGTSFAAPLVSGVAVLMLSVEPTLSADELKRRLVTSADPLPSLAGKTVSGGRLNAAKALGVTAPAAAAPAGAAPARRARLTAAALAPVLKRLARALRRLRIRTILKHDGITFGTLDARLPGRLTVELTSGKRTIAKGSCSLDGPRRCTLRAKLTRAGRALLRRARRARVTLTLRLKPRSAPALTRRATVVLRR
jgi:Subtilase family